MTRILFLPNPNTLLWLETDLPEDKVLRQIQAGEWLPPAPFDQLSAYQLSAACQDGVVIITLTGQAEAATSQGSPLHQINRRQREVLKALALGYTTRHIAHRLHLTPRMVMYYVAELKVIFQAKTRAELVSKTSDALSIGEETTSSD